MVAKISHFGVYKFGRSLYLFASPVILVVGVVGNVLSFMVLSKRAKKPPPTYLYLSVLAVADILALYLPVIQGFLKYLNGTDLTILMGCSWFFMLFFAPGNISTNIVAFVTVDRFICVYFPFAAVRICTIKRAITWITIICVFHIGLNLHYPWTLVVGEITLGNMTSIGCVAPPGFEDWSYRIWPLVDFTAYSFFPLVVLVIFNTLIVYKMARQKKDMSGAASNRAVSQQKTTMLLVMVSVCQLVTTSPIVLLHLVEPYWDRSDPYQQALHMMATSVCQHVSYINNSINLFLYGISGKKFRDDLMAEFRCCKQKKSTNYVISQKSNSTQITCSPTANSSIGCTAEDYKI